LHNLFEEQEKRTSFKNNAVMMNERQVKVAATRHGRKYGYFAQKGWENVCDQRSWGRDKMPPIKGLKGCGKGMSAEIQEKAG
jgi:hypothetical protein